MRTEKRVDYLASFLRIADGLDRRHLQYVVDLQSTIALDKVFVQLLTREFADREIEAGQEKVRSGKPGLPPII